VDVDVGFLEEVDLTLPQWRRRVLEKATASLILAMWMADDISTDETTMVSLNQHRVCMDIYSETYEVQMHRMKSFSVNLPDCSLFVLFLLIRSPDACMYY
jgi:hypothetical protein